MTASGKSLFLNRLVIIKNGNAIYDEKFGPGINIIRGSNSTGKTTIADAIFYSLGGDLTQMKHEFEICDFVIADILINESPVTLKREIDAKSKRPMYIHWGNYESSKKSADWEKYSYSRSENIESFSQVLFRLFDFPDVKSLSSKITMHQVLRLMYGDQKSNPRLIFRQEQFDSSNMREAIGNMLLGIYDNTIYELRVALDQYESKQKAIIHSLRTIYNLMGKAGFSEEAPLSNDRIKSLQLEQNELITKLDNFAGVVSPKKENQELSAMQKNLSRKKEDIANLADRTESLQFDINDSELFIIELQNKYLAINGSIAVNEVLEPMSFGFCPSCLSPISKGQPNHCGLCKENLSNSPRILNLNRIRNELEIQIKESSKVISLKKEQLDTDKKNLDRLRLDLKQSELTYRQLTRNSFSSAEVDYQSTLIQLGENKERINIANKFSELNDQLLALQNERDQLNTDIENTRLDISKEQSSALKREKIVHERVSKLLIGYLNADLAREEDFVNAQHANFDFGSNMIEVNDKSNFSESSEVYLKNVFLLSLLVLSCSLDFIRFPRFLLLDGLDQGGIEDARVQKLQKLIYDASNSLVCRHQIIFTTARINPLLEKDAYTVGQKYDIQNKTLRFKQ